MRLTVRDARAGDHRFIAASWSQSWGRPAAVTAFIPPRTWRTSVWESVPLILARPGVRAIVAADPTERDHVADLFGFLVWEPAAIVRTYDPLAQAFQYRRLLPGERNGQALPLVYYCYVKTGHRYDRASQHNARIASRLFRHAGIDQRAPFPFVCHTLFVERLRDAGKLLAAEHRPELSRIAVDTNPED